MSLLLSILALLGGMFSSITDSPVAAPTAPAVAPVAPGIGLHDFERCITHAGTIRRRCRTGVVARCMALVDGSADERAWECTSARASGFLAPDGTIHYPQPGQPVDVVIN